MVLTACAMLKAKLSQLMNPEVTVHSSEGPLLLRNGGEGCLEVGSLSVSAESGLRQEPLGTELKALIHALRVKNKK